MTPIGGGVAHLKYKNKTFSMSLFSSQMLTHFRFMRQFCEQIRILNKVLVNLDVNMASLRKK